MELQLLLQGFMNILDPQVIFWCVLGVIIGTLVGALPGLGPTAGVALLLPLSFTIGELNALTLLMSIYQGSMYGGSLTSILINVPGDASSAVTTLDGYQLTKKGKPGIALALSAIGSFIGGMIGFIGLIFLTPYVAKWAYVFGSPEYFALMLFALIATSGLGDKKLIKGLIAMGLGLLISMIGSDSIQGINRLTFRFFELMDGIDFVVVAIGVFGLSEVLILIEEKAKKSEEYKGKIPFRELFPTVKQILRNKWSIARGSIIGFLVGILPGAGATIATFLSYDLEKKLSKTPEEFGKGAEQGVSAPESANNASVGGALIPLFSLGIPGSGTTAVLLGALVMFGLQPGPLMLQKSGDLVWAVIAGLVFANVLLFILNTAFVPAFAILIKKAQPYLIPLIAALCFIGVYTLSNSFFDIGLMMIFGLLGYFMKKFDFPLTPFVLAVVLGKMIETNLRQSLLISKNDMTIFFTRPLSLTFMILTILILCLPVISKIYKLTVTNRRITKHEG